MIYVFGASGQLGQSLKKIAPSTQNITYLSSDDLDITKNENLNLFFKDLDSEDFIINCAAYTAVDKAEDEEEKAFLINKTAILNIADLCKQTGTKLIHISTDYVFDGESESAYYEEDSTKPIGVYGKSKRAGELEVFKSGCDFTIIRTAWVFSEFGNNFVKTMISLSNRETISVVKDQVGTPTYAPDLAEAIFKIIDVFPSCNKQIFHFSNSGQCSWYQFALAIMNLSSSPTTVMPILTSEYPTRAIRPKYSILNSDVISKKLSISIPSWEASLKICLDALK